MKTIGLIGGMSWESSLQYYKILNERVKKKLGGLHSAKCLLYSVDFGEIEVLQHKNQWDTLTQKMIEVGKSLKNGGADFIVICTNTMHRMAEEIESGVGLKVLHIADATGEAVLQNGIKKVALLGTKFTMEGSFYRDRLKEKYNIQTIIPEKADREVIHSIIYNELCLGNIREESREKYLYIITKLNKAGAEGVILGCTEIPLLVNQDHVNIPVFDTTRIHASYAVDMALR